MAGDTIVKESIGVLKHGHAVAGTTRVQLAVEKLSIPASKGVLVRCPGSNDPGGSNTKEVWLGGPNVTADENLTTGGMPVAPGEALFLPLEDPSLLFVVSTADDQDIAWMSL